MTAIAVRVVSQGCALFSPDAFLEMGMSCLLPAALQCQILAVCIIQLQ